MVDHAKCNAVRTACAETSVSYDMRVVRTRNIDHTIQILEAITVRTAARFHQGLCYFKKPNLRTNLNFTFLGQQLENPLYLTMDMFKKVLLGVDLLKISQ